MMHHVPQAGLAALAVAGPVERVVRRHRTELLVVPVEESVKVGIGATREIRLNPDFWR
jgi:hypothetical protein